jgi:hypothetical protein
MKTKRRVSTPLQGNSSFRAAALYRHGRKSLQRGAKSETMALADAGIRGMSV